nr:LysR family transcriptional regulator [uncultured Enterobacter sp.]
MNKTPDLSELEHFAAVARHRSFRKAADERGISASALSHALRSLEARLNVRLLNRTTRSVTPTEAGQRLLERLTPALEQVSDALAEIHASQAALTGTLRLNLPEMAARLVIGPVLTAFASLYPQIKLEIVSDDRLTDIVGEGFDAGMRYGESLSPDVIAMAVGPQQRFAVVASPEYLATNGTPERPDALIDHRCINRLFPSGSRYAWEFQRDGQGFTVALNGQLALSNEDMMLSAAMEGHGIAYVYYDLARPALEAGRLTEILSEWLPSPDRFYLYYHGRRHVPPALQALIRFFNHRDK